MLPMFRLLVKWKHILSLLQMILNLLYRLWYLNLALSVTIMEGRLPKIETNCCVTKILFCVVITYLQRKSATEHFQGLIRLFSETTWIFVVEMMHQCGGGDREVILHYEYSVKYTILNRIKTSRTWWWWWVVGIRTNNASIKSLPNPHLSN